MQLEYLQLLSLFRLRDRYAEPIKRFVAGVTDLIPEDALALLDENDLEVCCVCVSVELNE